MDFICDQKMAVLTNHNMKKEKRVWTNSNPFPSQTSKELLLYSMVFDSEYRTLEAYDFDTNSTFHLHETPTPVKQFSCLVATPNTIYDIGGTEKLDSKFLDPNIRSTQTVQIYTSSKENPIYENSMNFPRIYASGISCGEHVYAFGGDYFNEDDMSSYIHGTHEVLQKDNCLSTWSLKGSKGKEYITCAGVGMIGGSIYLAGGYEPYTTKSSNTVISYDYPQPVIKQSMNEPRSCFRLVEIHTRRGGGLIAIGGNGGDVKDVKNQTNVLNTVELYNPKQNTWTYLKSMKEARQHFGVLKVNSTIYVIGGNTGQPSIEAYDFENDEWEYIEWPSRLQKNIDFGFSTRLPSTYANFSKTIPF